LADDEDVAYKQRLDKIRSAMQLQAVPNARQHTLTFSPLFPMHISLRSTYLHNRPYHLFVCGRCDENSPARDKRRKFLLETTAHRRNRALCVRENTPHFAIEPHLQLEENGSTHSLPSARVTYHDKTRLKPIELRKDFPKTTLHAQKFKIQLPFLPFAEAPPLIHFNRR